MQNPWLELRQSIVLAVKSSQKVDISQDLEEPVREGFGDFALPCFKLSFRAKKDPKQLAEEISKLEIPNLSAKAVGPFVNWYVDWREFSGKIIDSVDNFYGKHKYLGKFATMEFSSPNPAHPFHMGTTRSTLIGEAVSRVLDSQGWDVKRICYMNDLGKQAAILLLGYLQKYKGKKPRGKPDVWLGKIYFTINKKIEADPKLNEKVEELLRENEKQGKTWSTAKKVYGWCLDGFHQNWRTLGIKFNKIVWESSFVKDGKDVIKQLEQKGLTFESEGALVLNLESHGLPSTIILRSDGTGLYLTRDIAHVIERFKEFSPELNVYVVGEDQRNHFKQMFKTLQLLGREDIAEKSKHLGYSMVLLEGKKMSARRGRVVLWDELLKEGTERAEKEVKKRWPKLSPAEKKKRAKSIALAAIIYYILKHGPEKPVDFRWDQALRFEGDTGPYLQYTHARCAAILRKTQKLKVEEPEEKFSLSEPAELAVVKLLAQYPQILAKAARELRPHVVCGYLFSLADAFSTFYEAVPVLRAAEEQREARIKLVEAVKHVMASGLDVLGIEAPERM